GILEPAPLCATHPHSHFVFPDFEVFPALCSRSGILSVHEDEPLSPARRRGLFYALSAACNRCCVRRVECWVCRSAPRVRSLPSGGATRARPQARPSPFVSA